MAHDVASAKDINSIPGVHPAVHDRIVHGVAHREPVNDKVDMLDMTVADDVRFESRDNKVSVLWQPADGEDDDHGDHHLHNLNTHLSSNNLLLIRKG